MNLFETNDEKLTEKAFSHGIFISVLSIILCIVALCSASYAWFTEDQSSGNNVIVSCTFDLTITVNKQDVEITTTENLGKVTCKLTEAGTYTVTLTIHSDSTVKGYCAVAIDDEEKLLTDSIYPDVKRTPNQLIFTIVKKTDSESTITFTPEWGIPAHASISDGTTIEIDYYITTSLTATF